MQVMSETKFSDLHLQIVLCARCGDEFITSSGVCAEKYCLICMKKIEMEDMLADAQEILDAIENAKGV
jgi:hypothetical protein